MLRDAGAGFGVVGGGRRVNSLNRTRLGLIARSEKRKIKGVREMKKRKGK